MTKPPRTASPEERALWARVVATVTPLKGRAPALVSPRLPSRDRAEHASPKPAPASAPHQPRPSPELTAQKRASAAATLDGSWDKRLARGLVTPESSIDLHGYTLASAHAILDRGLERAVARGDRVLLLITGRPPRPESERPHARGAIRAAVGDWLAASRHADRIAAIRGAHPRHGGQGALYIVLRRQRSRSSQKF